MRYEIKRMNLNTGDLTVVAATDSRMHADNILVDQLKDTKYSVGNWGMHLVGKSIAYLITDNGLPVRCNG